MRKLFGENLISIGMIVLLILMLTVVTGGCANGEERERDNDSYTVAVSILPQKYFVERITAHRVEIIVVVPPGASPATYEPSPSDMRNMSRADIWFTIGVEFERAWIPRFRGSNQDMIISSTIENIDRLPFDRYGIPEESVSSSAHQDNERNHSHGWDDPHVWLSPELVRKQAAIISEALSELDHDEEAQYQENLEQFNLEIDSLQNSIHAMLDPLEGNCFIVFHPAWGYFSDEFKLIQIPIEVSGSDPSPGEMSHIVDLAEEHDIQAIFVSPQFSTSSAEAIASEINAGIIYIDPLAENWSANLMHVAEELVSTVGSR